MVHRLLDLGQDFDERFQAKKVVQGVVLSRQIERYRLEQADVLGEGVSFSIKLAATAASGEADFCPASAIY